MVLLYLSVNISVFSAEKNTINWYKPDAPPGHILSGPLFGQGYSDQMQLFLIKQLPDYSHVDITANYQRAIIEMSKHTGCMVGIFPNEEREKYLIFSKVRQLVFANGLIIPERHYLSIAHLVDESGTISIEAFIDQTKWTLVGGIAGERVYGKEIDRYINDPSLRFVKRSSENVFSGLLVMLDLNRIDYIFGFPVELQYSLKILHLSEPFHFIPIKEMPEYLTSYIACSRSELGQELINIINANLTKYRQSDLFYNIYKKWLDKNSARRFEQLSDAYFTQHPKS